MPVSNDAKRHNHRLALAYEPIGNVSLNPRDARIYGAAEKRRVAKTVAALGAMPVIVSAERVVISGNIWLEAAILAGIAEVPVIVADHFSAAEADAFMLAQVRLVERGEWDARKVGEILRDLTLQPLDFDLEITGFDVPEIDLYIEGLGDPVARDEETMLPPLDKVPVSRLGDIWIAGRHRVGCADSREEASFAAVMNGAKADVAFADVPYNLEILGNVSGLGEVKHGEFAMASGEMTEEEFTKFLVVVTALAAAHCTEGSLAYWCMDWRHLHEMTLAGRASYDGLINLCVWCKNNGGMGSFYRSQHELIFVFKKGNSKHRNNVQLGRFGRNRSNVFNYPGINSFGRAGEEGNLLAMHPTVKPVALVADILLDASARGERVLDPFLGSGTTLIAAEKVGRCAFGLEIDPLYVDCAIRRWERWTGDEAVLESSGKTFVQVSAERTEKT